MKYLIVSDLKYILIKRKIWIALYLGILLLFPIFCLLNNYMFYDLFLINVGMKFCDDSFVFVIMYLFNLSFYIFIYLDLYLGNLKIGVDNLFLRLNKTKFLLGKIISCAIVTVIISSVSFLVIYLLYLFFNENINNVISYYFIFNLFHLLLSQVAIICLSCFLGKNKLFLVLLCLFLYLLKSYLINPYLFNGNLLMLICFLLIIFIFYLYILKRNVVKIFERSF